MAGRGGAGRGFATVARPNGVSLPAEAVRGRSSPEPRGGRRAPTRQRLSSRPSAGPVAATRRRSPRPPTRIARRPRTPRRPAGRGRPPRPNLTRSGPPRTDWPRPRRPSIRSVPFPRPAGTRHGRSPAAARGRHRRTASPRQCRSATRGSRMARMAGRPGPALRAVRRTGGRPVGSNLSGPRRYRVTRPSDGSSRPRWKDADRSLRNRGPAFSGANTTCAHTSFGLQSSTATNHTSRPAGRSGSPAAKTAPTCVGVNLTSRA